MRRKICLNSAASWVEAKMRWTVWHSTQLIRLPLTFSGPGALSINSALVGWAARFLVVAGRRRAALIMPGPEPIGREAVFALLVADHRDRDIAAIPLGADQHTFH